MNPSNTSVSFRPCDLRVMALLKGFVFIMESRPLLSWKISSDRTGFRQSAYRILAASDKAELLAGNADLWDSGRVESDRSLYVEWGGKELASRQHVCWQVTVWDENGMESEASEIAEFEIALQHNAEWEARWIHFDGNNPATGTSASYVISRNDLSLTPETEKILEVMASDAREEGITLVVSSTYRSYDYQKSIYERNVRLYGQEVTDRESARAGHSQHQLGTAIDFGSITDDFEYTKPGQWLFANAKKYGFSLSFPKGMEPVTGYRYECWHYRYIGVNACNLQEKWFDDVQQYMLEFINYWRTIE